MAVQPPGAQVSPDGNYWWDENAGQWQPVEGGAASSSSSSGGQQSSTGQQSSSGDDGPGQGQADTQVAGQCMEADLSDDEVRQILEAAGVSLDVS